MAHPRSTQIPGSFRPARSAYHKDPCRCDIDRTPAVKGVEKNAVVMKKARNMVRGSSKKAS